MNEPLASDPVFLSALCWQLILNYLGDSPMYTVLHQADWSVGLPNMFATGFSRDLPSPAEMCPLYFVSCAIPSLLELLSHNSENLINKFHPSIHDNVAFGNIAFGHSHHLWKYFPTFWIWPFWAIISTPLFPQSFIILFQTSLQRLTCLNSWTNAFNFYPVVNQRQTLSINSVR